MKLETKVQIAKTSLSLLVIVAVVFLLGVVVLVVCTGLQINPFRETTTSFLLAMFTGLIGVAAILVLFVTAEFSEKIAGGISEYYSLIIFALSGMLFAASANDFAMLFVSIEPDLVDVPRRAVPNPVQASALGEHVEVLLLLVLLALVLGQVLE